MRIGVGIRRSISVGIRPGARRGRGLGKTISLGNSINIRYMYT